MCCPTPYSGASSVVRQQWVSVAFCYCGQASRTWKNTVKPAALFFGLRVYSCTYGTCAESGLNGCKEAVIPAFPLHFFILMFVITLFLYINVCNVH